MIISKGASCSDPPLEAFFQGRSNHESSIKINSEDRMNRYGARKTSLPAKPHCPTNSFCCSVGFCSSHYGKSCVCFVPSCLPCAIYRAHGKKVFAVSHVRNTRQTTGTRQTASLPCAPEWSTRQRLRRTANDEETVRLKEKHTAKRSTWQTVTLCRVPDLRHTAKMRSSNGHSPAVNFAVCLALGTRQIVTVCRVSTLSTRQNI